MIIIIDTNTDICYYSKYKTKIAEFIGVNRSTVHRWLNNKKKSEKYNHLIIYLFPEKL